MRDLQFCSHENGIFAVPHGGVSLTETSLPSGDLTVTIDTTPETNSGYNSAVYTGDNAIDITLYGAEQLLIGSPPLAGFSTGSATLDEFKSATVHLAAHSHLISTVEMAFGKLTVDGFNATDTLAGTSVFAGTAVMLDTNLAGTGSMIVESIIAGTGILNGSAVIDGKVAAGVTITLTGNGNHAAQGGASLTLDKPKDFAGTVDINAGSSFVDLKGLHADSYSMMGDVLSLFSADKLVDTLHINNFNNLGEGPTINPFTVEHNASGILIATTGEDSFQTGGVGTALGLHS